MMSITGNRELWAEGNDNQSEQTPWEKGERCGMCGIRIDEDLTCNCAYVLNEEIDKLRAALVAAQAEVDRLTSENLAFSSILRPTTATLAMPHGPDREPIPQTADGIYWKGRYTALKESYRIASLSDEELDKEFGPKPK